MAPRTAASGAAVMSLCTVAHVLPCALEADMPSPASASTSAKHRRLW